jgi:hypothetical protein
MKNKERKKERKKWVLNDERMKRKRGKRRERRG